MKRTRLVNGPLSHPQKPTVKLYGPEEHTNIVDLIDWEKFLGYGKTFAPAAL